MRFEGEEIAGSSVTIRQFKGDIEVPLAVDEVVELKVMAKVSEVSFAVNQKTGQLTRVHHVQVQEVEVG